MSEGTGNREQGTGNREQVRGLDHFKTFSILRLFMTRYLSYSEQDARTTWL